MSRGRSGSAQLPESIRSEVGVGVPKIIASEIDVLPPDGGKVSKQPVRDDFPAAAEVVERTAEIHGIPEGDSGGDGLATSVRTGAASASLLLKRLGAFVNPEEVPLPDQLNGPSFLNNFVQEAQYGDWRNQFTGLKSVFLLLCNGYEQYGSRNNSRLCPLCASGIG